MSKIPSVKFNSIEWAQKKGMDLVSYKLKDGSSAKLMVNPYEVDCFIVKNGKIIGHCGARGSEENIGTKFEAIMSKLQKLVVPEENVLEKFVKATLGIVK